MTSIWVELYPVKLSHLQREGTILGEGETLSGDGYRFLAPLDTWRTVSRPLAGFSAAFHDNRWRFAENGQYVVYRHEVGGRRQTAATIKPTVWFHEPSSWRLTVEVSADGNTYRRLGQVAAGDTSSSFEVPAELLPAASVWVRLSCDTSDSSKPVFFQCTGYEYNATLDAAVAEARGSTAALTLLAQDPGLETTPEGARCRHLRLRRARCQQ